jgi:hypothetical protein
VSALSPTEVFYSSEFQQYALIMDEEIAFQYAELELLKRRERRSLETRRSALKTMPYREYLSTPEWGEKADRVRAAWERRCALCNRSGPLDVHHRTSRPPWR